MTSVDRRVGRLLRWYPPAWRARYGEEFAELLAAQIADEPRCARRTLDVIRVGVGQRWGEALGEDPCDPGLDRSRSAMALVYLSLTVFVGLALGMWSQLRTGVQVATVTGRPVPEAVGISESVLSITALVGLLLFLAVVARAVVTALRGGRAGARGHGGPALVLGSALGALSVMGWSADRSSWYTPAGAALPGRGPLHVGTLWIRGLVAPITPAWVHPSLFWRMPGGELVAVLVAPIAAVAAAAALLRMVQRSPRPSCGRAWDAVFAHAIVTAMAAFVVAAVRWIAAHPAREGSTFWMRRGDPLAPGHTAMAVVGVLVVLTVTAFVGARRALRLS